MDELNKVYKLVGECWEITGEEVVYSDYDKALNAAKGWEDFLGVGLEEALALEEIRIVEWELE